MELIEIDDKRFPNKLKEVKNPPLKLYVEGEIQNLNENCIAVIGSRNWTEYGKKWCEIFVQELVKYNVVIVSGMANGIDSVAHNTAINSGGKTIAVLPCGLNNIYPPENLSLYKKIIQSGGTVITEYEPEEKAESKKFLDRNRIVSGLSFAILVVEAAHRSGTSVTAKIAKSQMRDVYAIPRKFR